MADKDAPNPETEAFKARINEWAGEIMKAANVHAAVDPVAATAAVVTAAGRLAAISGLGLDSPLQLFLAQYNTMREILVRFEAELATPTETPKSEEPN